MIKGADMSSKLLAFRRALPVAFCLILLVPWPASAQTVSETEMFQGSWRLSEIRDDSGDRSGDIAKYAYVSTLSFYENLSADLFLAPIAAVTDTLFVSGNYVVNEEADSLTLNLLGLASLSSIYAFSGDSTVTFTVDVAVVNGLLGALSLVRVLYPDLGEFFDKLANITPYEGETVSFTYKAVSEPEKFVGKWVISYYEDEAGPRADNITRFLNEGSISFFPKGADPRPGIKSEGVYAYYNPVPEDASAASVWEIGMEFKDEFNVPVSTILNENNNWSTYTVDPARSQVNLLVRPAPNPLNPTADPPVQEWAPLYYYFEDDSTVVFTLIAPRVETQLNPLWDDFKTLAAAIAPALVPFYDQLGNYTGAVTYTFTLVDDTDVVSADRASELPETATLAQNYPNPFNPSTEITWYLEESGPVRLEVFDMAGRRVATLVDGILPQGEHSAQFNAEGLSTGSYAYRLTLGDGARTLTRTMTLVR